MQIEQGSSRTVILTKRHAFKIPRMTTWRTFLNGLLANMQEREFAHTGWPELCPVKFSFPGGWLVVMPRCKPVINEIWELLEDDDTLLDRGEYIIPAERKQSSFGVLNSQIVAIDYGN